MLQGIILDRGEVDAIVKVVAAKIARATGNIGYILHANFTRKVPLARRWERMVRIEAWYKSRSALSIN